MQYSRKWPLYVGNALEKSCDYVCSFKPLCQKLEDFFLLAAALVTQGMLCLLPIQVLGLINKISVFWNALGAITLMILLPVVAPKHQDAKFVFTSFDSQAYGHYKSDG